MSDDGERIRVLWRHRSHQNSILLTERCNHYCLMCSQPPKTREDDELLAQAFELLRAAAARRRRDRLHRGRADALRTGA